MLSYSKMLFKITALFALADGPYSEEENRILNKLASQLDLSASERWEIIGFCRDLDFEGEDCSAAVIRQISALLKKQYVTINFKIDTLWTLLSFGHADREYTKAEDTVIQWLIKEWEIYPRVVAELTDSINAIQLLTQQKEWLRTIELSESEMKRRIRKIDQNIHSIKNNVEVTIHEADLI